MELGNNLVESIHNFDRKFAVRRIHDVLFLHGRVKIDAILQRQLSTVAKLSSLKFSHAAKSLVLRIALPLSHNCFIT